MKSLQHMGNCAPNIPMEIVLMKKIGHPKNKEYTIGRASLLDYFVVSNSQVSNNYIEEELKNIRVQAAEDEGSRKDYCCCTIISKETIRSLENELDEVSAISVLDNFVGVGQFYRNFEQVEESLMLYCMKLAHS